MFHANMLLKKTQGSSPIRYSYHLITPVLVLILNSVALAQLYTSSQFKQIKSEPITSQPVPEVDHLMVPLKDNASLMEKAAIMDLDGPLHFADPFVVKAGCDQLGSWSVSKDGEFEIWRFMITSPEAKHLNIGFQKYHMPAGGELNIYSMINDDYIGPFTEADNESHGQLWTPFIFSDQVLIEAIIPSDRKKEFELEIETINHGFRDLGEVTGKQSSTQKSGSCNVDVNCSEGDLWREEISSVGLYSVRGRFTCTGALINNTRQDLTPYFLIAYHCGVRQGDAPSVVVYWNFQNSTCRAVGSTASGGNGNGVLNQFNSGAIFRSEYRTSDFTLIELDDPVNPAFEISYAGWDRRGIDVGSSIAIHHPNLDEKRISFDYDPTSITTYLGNNVLTNGTHVRVIDWDVGTTEPGSSGSPLFSSDHRILGQLHGGFAACGNDLADWYGRVAVSWLGGGSSSTRLSTWLDPDNTGLMTVDTMTPGDLSLSPQSTISDVAGTGNGNGIIDPGEDNVSYSLESFKFGSNESWSATLSSDSEYFIGESLTDSGTFSNGRDDLEFIFSISKETPCFSVIPMTLTLNIAGEVSTWDRFLFVGIETDLATPGTYYGDIGYPRVVEVPFVKSEPGTIGDVMVRVDIDHTEVRDNIITLISPAGTRVQLVAREGENDEQDFSNTIFSDSATAAIETAPAPFTGEHLPEQPLSGFAGQQIAGTWIVEIDDSLDGEVGTINEVELIIIPSGFECEIPGDGNLWITR